jgi:hypothetical protein
MSWPIDNTQAGPSHSWDAATRTRRITRACDRCHQTNTKVGRRSESVQRLTRSVRKDRLRLYVDHARSLVRDAPTIGRRGSEV